MDGEGEGELVVRKGGGRGGEARGSWVEWCAEGLEGKVGFVVGVGHAFPLYL